MPKLYLGTREITPAFGGGVSYSAGTGIDITSGVISVNFSDVATSAQGALADTALQPSALNGYATETWVTNQGYTTNVGTVTSVNNTSPDGNGNVSLTIPTVNNSTITITQGGVTKGSFTLNQSAGDTIALDAGGGTDSYKEEYGENIYHLNDVPDLNTGLIPFFTQNNTELVFSGIKNIPSYCLYQKLRYNLSITSCVFNDLEKIGYSGLGYAFFECKNMVSCSFQKLSYISPQGLGGCFSQCSSLTSANFPLLKYISLSGLSSTFNGCSLLGSINFPYVDKIDYNGMVGCFASCLSLSSIYFNSLTTSSFGSYVNQFNNMFNSGANGTAATSGNVTIHFPSNLSSTISGLTGYPNFGATAGRVTLSFDLPATS